MQGDVVVDFAMKKARQTKKPKWYPRQKKIKPDKDWLENAVSKFLAKGGQIKQSAPKTKKS
jgi:hypothetical protein